MKHWLAHTRKRKPRGKEENEKNRNDCSCGNAGGS